MPTVQEISRKAEEVVTVDPEATVEETAQTMEEENVGCVIIAEDNEPTGIVTDRDIAIRVVSKGRNPSNLTAGDIMSDDVVTVDTGEEISDVIQKLGESGVRRLPVVEDGEIAGIITLDDIVVMLAVEQRSISAEFDSISSVIRSESPPY
ncbi:MAG: CBS domain-containing protein [Halobacteria archaeon]|nr:CBS domain-containing protein [Halobacteria archaeon]